MNTNITKKPKTSFSTKKLTKELLACLPERAKDVIVKRFGLLEGGKKMTLEAIGKLYGITRERVRQIENFSVNLIRKSDAFAKNKTVFDELRGMMNEYGGIVSEQEFLDHVSKDHETQNHLLFYLVIDDQFSRMKEDEEFKHRWSIDPELSEKVHNSLKALYTSLSEEDLVSESDMILRFLDHLGGEVKELRDEEMARRWLSISKKISRNKLGEWGVAHSPNIKTRGIRDLAYLVLRKHGSPMHFSEVAKIISETFGRPTNIATCHNELIKDSRFVLVGRGLYALKKWGYSQGTVRDIIRSVLQVHGPLSKEEIIRKVLRERYVKENTVLVNLHNTKHFKKDKEGKYSSII
ncbi:MAG: sigma factor-like helix-turn-helix DNA-binding protein [Candidatus Paceibacterota bacterium]|jgi:hypothetical protein